MTKLKYQIRSNYLRAQIQISGLKIRMKHTRSRAAEAIRSLFV